MVSAIAGSNNYLIISFKKKNGINTTNIEIQFSDFS